MLTCVDVSEWNGLNDWNVAKANGLDAAFIRCGFGQDSEGQDDKCFIENIEGALSAGIKVGVYFYSYATNYDTACSEAHHCLRLIEPYRDRISFPIFYDLEEERNKARIKDIFDGFRNTLEYYGYNVGAYTSVSWYDAYFQPIDCDYIWLASWGPDDGFPHNRYRPEYCDIWQYTSKGSADGIGYNCVDLDYIYNEDMKLLFDQPDPEPTPAPDPIEKTVNIDILIDADESIKVNVNVHRVNKD